MADSNVSTSPAQKGEESPEWTSAIDNFFTPGSTRHPVWLLALDIAFAGLFAVLVGLLFLTNGSIHLWALLFIESCLWASVKWFVYELQNMPPPQEEPSVEEKKKE